MFTGRGEDIWPSRVSARSYSFLRTIEGIPSGSITHLKIEAREITENITPKNLNKGVVEWEWVGGMWPQSSGVEFIAKVWEKSSPSEIDVKVVLPSGWRLGPTMLNYFFFFLIIGTVLVFFTNHYIQFLLPDVFFTVKNCHMLVSVSTYVFFHILFFYSLLFWSLFWTFL